MWCLPSYARPEKAARLLQSMVAHGMKAKGALWVNADDPRFSEYAALELPDGWVMHELAPGSYSADAYRAHYDAYANEPWFGITADDIVIKTDGFEERLVAAAGDRFIAIANDEWQAPARMHGTTVIGAELVRAIGSLSPMPVKHMCVDDFWEYIGSTFGCWRPVMDVVTPHLHKLKDPTQEDATYARSEPLLEHDRRVFMEWMRSEDWERRCKRVEALFEITTTHVDLRDMSLCYCVPAGRFSVLTPHYQSMFHTQMLMTAHGVRQHLIVVPGDSILHKARNECIEAFLRTDFDYMLFVDDDMSWHPNSVARMLGIMKMGGKHVVGAAGPRKMYPINFAVRCMSNTVERCMQTACIPVDGIGAAFLMVSRHALETLAPMLPRYQTPNSTFHRLWTDFPIDPPDENGVPGHLWSEDFAFCKNLRKAGFDIWCDPTIWLDHFGIHGYGGAFMDTLRPVQENADAQQVEGAGSVLPGGAARPEDPEAARPVAEAGPGVGGGRRAEGEAQVEAAE